MRHHDHKMVLRDLLQDFHHLHTGIAVQRAGRLVRQNDVRVIDQRPRDGHPLHLPAGELIRLFIHMLFKTDLPQRLLGPPFSLPSGDAGDRQRKLHVGPHALMHDQIVALEHEADGVVAVGVPVPVAEAACGDAVDDQIPGVIAVKAADDIQQRGLSGSGRAEDRDKLVVPETEAHAVQRLLDEVSRPVLFADIANLKHSVLL